MPSGGGDEHVVAQAASALEALTGALGRDLLAVYLYGSAVAGGLRPDSDLDLFAVTRRRLRQPDRQRIVHALTPISARRERPADWRPLELTVVALDEVRPWRYPPRMELQYGEWLREAFDRGDVGPAEPHSPDLAVLVSMVRSAGRPLLGSPAVAVLDAVPAADVRRAMVDSLPALLDDLEDDTRNVLLTLARMWCTAVTGELRPKDAAADWVLGRLPEAQQAPLRRARDLYRGGGFGPWNDAAAVRETAGVMAAAVDGAVPSSG